MNATASREPFNPPRVVKFQITTWGNALRNVRIKMGLSYREVEAFVGVPKGTCKLWEDGLGFASGYQLKGLYGRGMHALRAYAHLLPERSRTQLADAEKGDPSTPPAPPTPAPAEDGVQEIDKPRDFRSALRLARLAQGLHQHELAELLDVVATTISAWETGVSNPIQDHYDKLLVLLPELADVPAPRNLRDMEKPGVPSGTPPTLPALPPAVTTLVAGRAILPPVAPELTAVDTAGLAYARAMMDQKRCRDELEDARAAVMRAEQQLKYAGQVVVEAREKLDKLIG